MEINLPDSVAPLLRDQAAQAGYSSVEEYALAVLLARTTPEAPKPDKSFYDAAQTSGLLDGGSAYSEDLSSNPSHLNGFGR